MTRKWSPRRTLTSSLLTSVALWAAVALAGIALWMAFLGAEP